MLKIHEISIVIAANNHNPTILNPDFLKNNDIVPPDYEISGNPICVYPVAQVQYKNEISIAAQLQKLIFSENLQNKSIDDAEIPDIARKYVKVLEHVDYSAVGINPKGYITVEGTDKFVLNKFIAPGPWKEKKSGLSKAKVTFVYPKKYGAHTMIISDSTINLPDKGEIEVVAFESNFHHNIVDAKTQEKVTLIRQVIKSWKNDIREFDSLINKTYLKG